MKRSGYPPADQRICQSPRDRGSIIAERRLGKLNARYASHKAEWRAGWYRQHIGAVSNGHSPGSRVGTPSPARSVR
jgi:hypothetical protein